MELIEQFHATRLLAERLCENLEPDDYCLQGMPDTSPTKWHLAHTTWFFETFVLAPEQPGYTPYHPKYAELFNSYYNSVGTFYSRPHRGMLTRPTVNEILAYRNRITDAVQEALSQDAISKEGRERIIIGIHHEQQHIELMLTDLLYGFSLNPLYPAYQKPSHRQVALAKVAHNAEASAAAPWLELDAGVYQCGYDGNAFCYDNEQPRHNVYLHDVSIMPRLVTNRDYLAFMEDEGYKRHELWLSEGWSFIQRENISAPLYWQTIDNTHWHFGLNGLKELDMDAPVCHVSFFEADAYCKWRNGRLPTEFEWEKLCIREAKREDQASFLESAALETLPANGRNQLFGDAWEWTLSAYAPYPGYKPVDGALGEYNGKFMMNQQVLRGGSCATPKTHIRATYRNFFPPTARWQFSGFRMTKE